MQRGREKREKANRSIHPWESLVFHKALGGMAAACKQPERV